MLLYVRKNSELYIFAVQQQGSERKKCFVRVPEIANTIKNCSLSFTFESETRFHFSKNCTMTKKQNRRRFLYNASLRRF